MYKLYVGGIAGRRRGYCKAIKSAKPQNVYLGLNVPESLKEALLSKCQVYLHSAIWESFGIAPLEAMVARATPVVHKSSVTWTDVCEERYRYGFSAADSDQVAERVREALEEPIMAPE
ncbi:MAG: glycosyltransferase [Acidilobaceae archaeon]